ncbi:two-component system sensor histidine kinase NtrB [Desulfoluna spongiiphila]|uniref:two-component system sensor histidine kinase NtrB n=1 Tax=Desulfoluna spongiiphila TaxID=419481 RepID=UPI001251150E|nr:ATP-binding protein [Desulfoluna spongiiphila]VVS94194.1 histidine kinase domain [Desulfoluna spongiiphila]
MIVSSFPIFIVDLVGSMLMIVFSLFCFGRMVRLTTLEKENILWTYLLFVCAALSIFAVSRSAGHILKQLLLFLNFTGVWGHIRPFSGSVNTLTFILVASVTVFFERVWVINRAILRDRRALRQAHEELSWLNRNLEKLVGERTEALAVSEKKYRRMFELSEDMILVTTGKGNILALNPAGGKRLDTGASFGDLFVDGDEFHAIMETVSGEGRIGNTEAALKGVGGRCFRALVSGVTVTDMDSRERNVLFMVRDVEETLTMREQMATTEKLAAVGELSAGVAHEVNNPLGIILGYTQLLKRSAEDESSLKEDLSVIEKHVIGCKKVVESLLNFARSGPSEKQACHLHPIIEEVLAFTRHQAEMDGIQVITELGPDLPEIHADAEKVKQVLINLIINAVHAIDGQGEIHVTTGSEGPETVFVTVADTGSGMDAETRSRIFDPFFTTKPTGTGTGLGLSVSYGIVKNHGGEIDVISTPGKGTAFTVHLPTVGGEGKSGHRENR